MILMLKPIFDIVYKKCHNLRVRTTLSLDDDILELASRQAKLRGVSLEDYDIF